MQKVFWVFPHPSDKPERWDRLDVNVKKQMTWLINPKKFDSDVTAYKEY
jgi:hypothetical protein